MSMTVAKVQSHRPPSLQQLQARREEVIAIFSKHGASDVKVFGSVARGEAGLDSDVDFLCTIPDYSKITAWFPAGLILDLEEALGCKVDVGTEAVVLASPIGAEVRAELVAL